MNLNDNQKLNNFAEEAFNEAQSVSASIKAAVEREKNEKLDEGGKKIKTEVDSLWETETDKIRKEMSLEISKKNIELRQEYLKFIDSISNTAMNAVRGKLCAYTHTDSYTEYLKDICLKNTNDGIVTEIYHSPADGQNMEKVKKYLADNKTGISPVSFHHDKTIKIGGLKFYKQGRNIQINETLDEKLSASKEDLDNLIGKYFHGEEQF